MPSPAHSDYIRHLIFLGHRHSRVSTSTYYFQQVSKALSNALAEIAAIINTLPNQIDSLE